MDDEIETLMVEVRANTSGFRSDMAELRGALDTSLVGGFARAGDVLERGLLSAIRRGKLGFEELQAVALTALSTIAAQAIQSGIGALFAGGASGNGGASGPPGLAGLLGSLANALSGAPGRATGGPVAPGRPFLVGERGPELFVPTSAGRIETNANSAPRDIRVAINLAAPRGTDTPQMLRRSGRQVASAVARAVRDSV